MDIFDLFNNTEPSTPEEYERDIKMMWCRMQDWRSKNPKSEVRVIFKSTPKMIVVAPIRTALQLGLVQVNEHGYEMLRAMCEPMKDQPTMAMVELAINLNPKDK